MRGAIHHTILIVDDEIDVLESLRHLLHRSYRVLTAGSGEEALELLHHDQVHVILSDQRMPGMTGDAFLAQARRLHPDTVRILFTGYADIQAVTNAVNEGAIFRYVVKPWDADELQTVIRQAVEQYDLVTERKRLLVELQEANERLSNANARLDESNQLKSAFIEVAGHEFNTPITLVLGLSELLLLSKPDRDPAERRIIGQISTSAKQLARLVANTLTMMRSNDFQRRLQREPVDLAALLGETVERVGPFLDARGLRLATAIDPELGIFEIDAAKIRDAVLNLLTNAIKFTPDGGEIRLSARLIRTDEAEIEIVDSGIGLEPRALKRLFEPFFTEFDPSRHSTGDFGFKKRGLGLGLSIVRQFLEMHGGGVKAESRVGEGTTITVTLPRRPFPKPGFEVELG
ncbi:MAG: hybrid sensor histidine kinase/response regulator [Isosphaeraceae bacterium]|nr:hybrid sensor histidine kinase/response regulator [Isosphaeraceae bacterium]